MIWPSKKPFTGVSPAAVNVVVVLAAMAVVTTPLVIWSNKTGPVKDIGTISPAFLSYHILKQAGFEHPYYTGFLGNVFDQYHVIDRYMLIDDAGKDTAAWSRQKTTPPLIRDYRFLQHDMMFGKRFSTDRFFKSHAELFASAAETH